MTSSVSPTPTPTPWQRRVGSEEQQAAAVMGQTKAAAAAAEHAATSFARVIKLGARNNRHSRRPCKAKPKCSFLLVHSCLRIFHVLPPAAAGHLLSSGLRAPGCNASKSKEGRKIRICPVQGVLVVVQPLHWQLLAVICSHVIRHPHLFSISVRPADLRQAAMGSDILFRSTRRGNW